MIYQILFNYESPLQGNGQISKICECKKIADERTVQKKREREKRKKEKERQCSIIRIVIF